MKKIILVVGQSASGKTTWVKENFIGEEFENLSPVKLIKTCLSGNNLLLGHYNLGIRCEGTDTLSYAALPALIEYLPLIIDKVDILIAEGDRISSKKFFDFVKTLGIETELHYFKCPMELSMKRRTETGSDASEKFVKTTITKASNMFFYGTLLGFKTQIHEQLN